MVSKKIVVLVRRLFQMTQEEKLLWQETGREGVYQIGIDDYIVQVAEQRSDEPAAKPAYELRICNAKGVVLEQINDNDIKERVHHAEGFMCDLYQRARRIALGVETALDKIIKRLEDEEPPEAL